jgi:hypothetical protein
MPPGDRRFHALCLVALFAFGVCAHAQARATSTAPPIVVSGLGKGTIPLGGPWQFHLGDDPAWANPTFDDSHWEQIDVGKPWGDQGHWAYTGHAWYRRHIEIKDETSSAVDVALYVPVASCSYEVYWNGRLIGRTDPMPGESAESQPAAAVFKLGAPGPAYLLSVCIPRHSIPHHPEMDGD